MDKRSCDLAIIGAGPAGYTAAIKAAQHGANVILIEKGPVGGTCLNVGCIPTKALIEGAVRFSEIDKAAIFGIHVKDKSLDFQQLQAYKNNIIKQLSNGIEFLLKANKIELIRAHARLSSNTGIEVDDKYTIEAKNILIACGSKITYIKINGLSDQMRLDSTSILDIDEVPKRLLIVGGGVIGLEFGWLFKKLGSSVTIVEKMPNILPNEDIELTNRLKGILSKDGISIFTSTSLEGIEGNQAKISDAKESRTVEFDRLLMAIGRAASTSDLGLEKIGVALSDRKEIIVDKKMRTNIPNIYACGDCIGGYQLAHAAYLEADIVIKNIFEQDTSVDYLGIPRCVYVHPEVAAVGLTEEQAKKDYDIKVGKFPFLANSRSIIQGDKEGFIKIISDSRTEKILGAHILGPLATELINDVARVIKMGLTVKEAVDFIYAHPTVSEVIEEALLSVNKKAVHIKN